MESWHHNGRDGPTISRKESLHSCREPEGKAPQRRHPFAIAEEILRRWRKSFAATRQSRLSYPATKRSYGRIPAILWEEEQGEPLSCSWSETF